MLDGLGAVPDDVTRRLQGWGSASRYELEELGEINVAARDYGDYRSWTGFTGERSGEGERARPFRDDAGLFRHQTHGALHLVQTHHDAAVHNRLHALPHPRKHALAARAVHKRGFPVRERLRRAFGERERGGRCGLRLG